MNAERNEKKEAMGFEQSMASGLEELFLKNTLSRSIILSERLLPGSS